MAEENKRVNNQLFSASVTGSTFEEFSQHAMLFPVQEPQPPPQVTPPLSTTPGMMEFDLIYSRKVLFTGNSFVIDTTDYIKLYIYYMKRGFLLG